MQIYTGQSVGKNFDKIKERGLGMMLSANDESWFRDYHNEAPLALDNGAFPNASKNRPYNPYRFMRCLDRCYDLGFDLDFVVVPDLIGGRMSSLDLSVFWAQFIIPGPRLALVVQDGMNPKRVQPYLELFEYVFIGGSVKWKWKTAQKWVDLARQEGKKIHIGQCGQLSMLRRAKDLGVDSVDSVSFVRNGSWHILDEFHKPTQAQLWPT